MALKQTDTEFFRPLWRRVLVTLIVAGWFAWECIGGFAFSIPGFITVEQHTPDQLWMLITGAALAYCVWNLFLRFPQDPPGTTGGGTPPAAS